LAVRRRVKLVGAVAVIKSSSKKPIAITQALSVTVVIDGGLGINVPPVAAVGLATSSGVVVSTFLKANAICTEVEDSPVAVVSGVAPIILYDHLKLGEPLVPFCPAV
jgi:hypothetical protein